MSHEILLASGTINDVSDTLTITSAGQGQQVIHDGEFTITCETSWPIAPLFDLFGAEALADMLWNETGAILDDVEGKGFNTVVLHCRANIFQVTPLVAIGIVAVLISVGIIGVTVFVESPGEFLSDVVTLISWAWIAAIIAVAVVGSVFVYRYARPFVPRG